MQARNEIITLMVYIFGRGEGAIDSVGLNHDADL